MDETSLHGFYKHLLKPSISPASRLSQEVRRGTRHVPASAWADWRGCGHAVALSRSLPGQRSPRENHNCVTDHEILRGDKATPNRGIGRRTATAWRFALSRHTTIALDFGRCIDPAASLIENLPVTSVHMRFLRRCVVQPLMQRPVLRRLPNWPVHLLNSITPQRGLV